LFWSKKPILPDLDRAAALHPADANGAGCAKNVKLVVVAVVVVVVNVKDGWLWLKTLKTLKTLKN
jgi:hypothetical protein